MVIVTILFSSHELLLNFMSYIFISKYISKQSQSVNVDSLSMMYSESIMHVSHTLVRGGLWSQYSIA